MPPWFYLLTIDIAVLSAILLSYYYYLSSTRENEEIVAGLQELIHLNNKKTFFLLFHVLEWSDIKRVKGILDELGPEIEVVYF